MAKVTTSSLTHMWPIILPFKRVIIEMNLFMCLFLSIFHKKFKDTIPYMRKKYNP